MSQRSSLRRPARLSIARLRGTAGVIDLASIMVGLLVTAIVGGIVGAALMAVIPWTQDLAAKQSLNAVMVAQATAKMNSGAYADYDVLVSSGLTTNDPKLDAITGMTGKCYVAGARSASGTIFYASSNSSTILDDNAGAPDTTWCNHSEFMFTRATNLATNPSFETAGSQNTARTNLYKLPTGTVERFPYTSVGGASATVSAGTSRVLNGVTYPTARVTNNDDANTRAAVSVTGSLALTTTFTVSVDVFAPAGAVLTSQNVVAIARDDAANDSYAGTFVTPTTLTNALIPGKWNRLTWVVTPNAGRTVNRIYFVPSHDPVIGDWWEHTRIMVLAGDQRTVDYFDGSTTTLNLATNPRASAVANFSSNNSVYNTSTWQVPITGNPSGIATAAKSVSKGNTADVLSMYNLDGLADQGQSRYLGAWVYVSAPGYNARWFGETTTAIAANTWVFLSSRTAIARFSWTGLYITKSDGSIAPTSDFAYTTGVVAQVQSPVAGFYDSSSQDFTYGWTGTPGASTSSERAMRTSGTAQGNAFDIQSSEWHSAGAESLRVRSTYVSVNSAYIGIGGDTSALRLGMTPGKTYTALARVKMVGARGVAVPRIYAYTRIGTGSYVPTQSNLPADAAGETLLRVTFTVPVGATEAFVRLINMGPVGSDDVWFDEFMLTEGTYTGPYLDGDSNTWAWSGTPHASTSSGFTITVP